MAMDIERQLLPETWTVPGNNYGWLIVEQDGFRTHYLCRACLADLTDLRVHHVVCCPYCTVPLPFLLDDEGRQQVDNAVVVTASWPYDLLRERFLGWCPRVRFSIASPPDFVDEDGTQSWEGKPCRLLAAHDGPCRFDGPKERPPLNPLKGNR